MKAKDIVVAAVTVCLLLGGVACENEPKSSKEYLKEWPPAATYDEGTLPMVEGVSMDVSTWDGLSLPLTVTGEDSGDDSIMYSVTLAHYWLLKTMHPDGDYLYEWHADTDEATTSSSTIQMLAVAWSQALLYRFALRPEFLIASYRALTNNMGGLAVVDDPNVGEIAISSNNVQTTAFTLLTMIEVEELSQTDAFGDYVDLMGAFFKQQVDDSGCVWTRYPASGECDATFSEFAIGQTLVSLMRLYRYTGDESYLDAVERAARYYYSFYQERDSVHTYFIAWNVGPFVELLLERPDEELEQWVFSMADYMVGDQYQPGDRESYVGGFKKRGGGIPTWSAASMVEPVIEAYRLAEARGDEARMQSYYDTGRYGLHFLTHLQYRASNVYELGLANPEKAIGAYHFSHWPEASSISHHFVRCDYMDHFAISILKGVDYLHLPESYPGPGFSH